MTHWEDLAAGAAGLMAAAVVVLIGLGVGQIIWATSRWQRTLWSAALTSATVVAAWQAATTAAKVSREVTATSMAASNALAMATVCAILFALSVVWVRVSRSPSWTICQVVATVATVAGAALLGLVMGKAWDAPIGSAPQLTVFAGATVVASWLIVLRLSRGHHEPRPASVSDRELEQSVLAEMDGYRSCARHEAAHAVVATTLGLRVIRVDVIGGTDVAGATEVSGTGLPACTESTWKLLVTFLASDVVDVDQKASELGGENDVSRAVAAAFRIVARGDLPPAWDLDVPISVDTLLVAARHRAAQILVAQASAVSAVAERLVQKPGSPIRSKELGQLILTAQEPTSAPVVAAEATPSHP